MLDILWWILISALLLAGLVGTFVPALPGTTLILVGVLVHRLVFGAEGSVGWLTIGILTVLMLLAQAIDILGSVLGAKWLGASRWGILGVIVGATVGLFFGLWGLLLGPLLGALAAELIAGKELVHAGKAAWGTIIGTAFACVGKLALGITMVSLFFFMLFFG
jgi:uncharacterized protein YqgC (DUF456 family)